MNIEMARVTLLTDFGWNDGYVAAMKGVMAASAPDLLVDDCSHDIPPGDVRMAAWVLARYWKLYPPGTVHLVVVDPGVGGRRRGLVASAADRLFVGPDNGVLSYVADEIGIDLAVELPGDCCRRDPVSPTFHGRDVFAPIAARLAVGERLEALGPEVADLVLFLPARAVRQGDQVHGEVIHVDRFGNLITNIPGDWIAEPGTVVVAGRRLNGVRRTYVDVAGGDLLALVGSAGTLEIGIRDGSAAAGLGVGRGQAVQVLPGEAAAD